MSFISASNTFIVQLNKDLSSEELRNRLENLIEVLKVLIKYSTDKTELASFLATVSCEWQEELSNSKITKNSPRSVIGQLTPFLIFQWVILMSSFIFLFWQGEDEDFLQQVSFLSVYLLVSFMLSTLEKFSYQTFIN